MILSYYNRGKASKENCWVLGYRSLELYLAFTNAVGNISKPYLFYVRKVLGRYKLTSLKPFLILPILML